MSGPRPHDPLTRVLEAVRRRVLLDRLSSVLTRSVLLVCGTILMVVALDALGPASHPWRPLFRWLPVVALVGALFDAARRWTPVTDRRLTLLVDEVGGLDGVATTYRNAGTGPVAEAFRERAGRRLAEQDLPARVRVGEPRGWIGSFALLATTWLVIGIAGGRDFLEAWWANPSGSDPFGQAGGVTAVDAAPLPSLGTVRFTIEPPRYSGLPASDGIAGDPIQALPGSVIQVRGTGSVPPAALIATVVGGDALTPNVEADGWTLDWLVGANDRGVQLELAGPEGPLERRVLPLRLLRDRPPEVTLTAPDRDLVLATASGRIPIMARATDDFGIASLVLHWVRSRGSGESFDFDEGEWTWDTEQEEGSGRSAQLSLDVGSLGLEPGDILHIRATTADGNDVTGPGRGVSSTRQIRISRDSDLSDITTLIGFPIEREREPLLSQRMIILLTEELLDTASRLDRETLRSLSVDIADEQARLRARIGEQIFSRATGAMQDPEAHLDFEEGEPEVFLDELEALAEQGPVIDPETGIATVANVEIPAHDHDSDPIVAINRSLLTVYNLMWDAERQLRPAQLDPSLVPQYAALDELQRLRDSERVFARGRVTVPPLAVDEVRGGGEVDDAAPSTRSRGVPTERTTARVRAEVRRMLTTPEPLVGRLVSLELSGLALDVLRDTESPTVAEALARASDLAASEDSAGVRTALAGAARLLREAETRTTPPIRQPSRLSSARYVTPDSASPTESEPDAIGGAAPFVFATVRYESGDWDSAPLVPMNLLHSLAQYTDVPLTGESVIVDLSSARIFDYPFLYLTGHLPVFFSDAESRNLVDFVDRGGLIFIDDHNHDIDGAFHRSVSTELERLFGQDRLQPVPNDHELYSSFFVFDDGPPITGHELSGWGDGLIHRELQQIESRGRIGVLYSNKDYSSEWSYHADNKRFLAVDNTRFGVNILVYALTR